MCASLPEHNELSQSPVAEAIERAVSSCLVLLQWLDVTALSAHRTADSSAR